MSQTVTPSRKWSLPEALAFVNDLEHVLAPLAHVALAGSVLRGVGNDLDVIVYPRTTETPHDKIVSAVRVVLHVLGKRVRAIDEVQAHWRASGSNDAKRVESWFVRGKKIDVFYLR